MLLPAVLTADRKHATPVGYLNLSEGLSEPIREEAVPRPTPIHKRASRTSPGCHITGPILCRGILTLVNNLSLSKLHRVVGKDTTCRWLHFIPHIVKCYTSLYVRSVMLMNSLQDIKYHNHTRYKHPKEIIGFLLSYAI